MKNMMTILVISLAVSISFARNHRGIPEELRSQLTEDQIAQLEDASSREARRDLLASWGIEMPAPPEGRRGPPPKLDEATKNQLESLRTQYEAAATDEEKESIREQMRELFHASRSDDEKRGVRRFFKDHPERPDGAATEAAGSFGRR